MVVGYKDLNQVVVVVMQGFKSGSGGRDTRIKSGSGSRDTRI